MSKRLILAVDDDPRLLTQLREELARYTERYRLVLSHSGPDALEHLEHAVEHGEQPALIIADEDLPMTGAQFLADAGPWAGSAKRILLCTHAEAVDAGGAMEHGGVDEFVVKPWTTEGLWSVIDDVLADWESDNPPPEAAVRVVGHRWAKHSHELKDFLGRNLVPYRWLDLDRGREGQDFLGELALDAPHLPVVVLPDGTALADPSVAELADALGLHAHPDTRYYDLVIVGGGPAGLAAAVYGASEGLSTLMIERQAPGGQAGTSSRIENYLGFPMGVSGADLARRAVTQARRLGAEILAPQEATRLELNGPYKILHLKDGTEITARAVIIATGVSYRELSTPGLHELSGAGVYYGAATTEAQAAQGEDVFVVGAANSAGQGAMYFSRFARSVTMLVRGADLSARMSQYLIDQISNMPNISVRPHTHVVEAHGDDHLEALTLEDTETGEQEQVPASFLFVFIGAQPRNDWLGGLLATDEHGYILAGPDLGGRPPGWTPARLPYFLETSVPGVFVAGDARHGSIRRVAGGVGEGSTCVQLVHRYLADAG